MKYEVDAFGRLLSMKFPGSGAEVVTYAYDRGGLVRSAVGTNTQTNPQHPDEPPVTQYLLHIGYDEFEQRVRVVHGNGIATSYKYHEKYRRPRLCPRSRAHGERVIQQRRGSVCDGKIRKIRATASESIAAIQITASRYNRWIMS
ncbi:hypothetical protein [Sorangium sp. So ce1335]|uniref:hypothetical protein n=1 Tax=Sorangium sp. So ce1335 TaxID=3133335 RepID=UPI003F616ECB